MPDVPEGQSAVADQVRAELELIRAHVTGVRGSLAATSDGLVVAHDIPDVEPSQVAALAAATLSLARRSTLATGCGEFREAVARGDDGYLAVFAAGESTIVAVIGTSSLNVGMLHFRARAFLERIATYSSRSESHAAASRPPAIPTPIPTPKDASANGQPPAPPTLPKRRPPTS